MIISKKLARPLPLPVTFNNTAIARVYDHCHLGLWLSDNMTWDKHVHETVKKTSRSLNLMKRMSWRINRKTKLFIYRCYIRPKLEYGTSVFSGNLSKKEIDKIENVQRHALLCATNAYRHTSHDKLLREAGFEPLMMRRRYFGFCHLYKIIHNLTPTYLSSLLAPYVRDLSTYRLRNANDFSIPRTTKTYLRLSFFWNDLHNWNCLAEDIRSSLSLKEFKRKLKNLLFYQSNKLYDIHTDKGSVHHARMRMGLSGLNAHRKKYNFINFANCPLCGRRPENTEHFFFSCPYLAAPRTVLLGDIRQIFTTRLPAIKLNPTTRNDFHELNSIFLCGSNALSFDENVLLFKAIHMFICTSKRFDSN